MFGYEVALLLSCTILLPTLVGAVRFFKLPGEYRIIASLIFVGFLVELLMFILPYWKVNNLMGMHVFALAEIVLLSLFFRSQIRDSRVKTIVTVVAVGLSVFAVFYSFIGKNVNEFNSLPRALESIYFALLSGYFFYEMTIDPQPVLNSVYFINGSILFYFTSCFIVFAFSNYLINDQQNLLILYNLHSIVNALTNLAYATGLWIASRSSYSVS
jgi:hypothetical protein